MKSRNNIATIGAITLLLCGGCVTDRRQVYSTVGQKGEEFLARDARERAFVRAPDPNSRELIPLEKKPEKKDEKKPEEKPTVLASTQPDNLLPAPSKDPTVAKFPGLPSEAELGVPFYPNSVPMEGSERIKAVLPGASQVLLETDDPLSRVEGFYLINFRNSKREAENQNGKAGINFLQQDNGVVRSIYLVEFMKKTHITINVMRPPHMAPANILAPSAAQPNPNPSTPSTPAPENVSPLPPMRSDPR